MSIKYFMRSSYGNQLFYFFDSKQAKAWQRMTGNQTLTPEKAEAAKIFGLTFEQVADLENFHL